MVFRLSGNPLKCKEFYNFGDVKLANSTHLTFVIYIRFVVAYKLIVFHPLHPKLKNGRGYVV